MNLITITLIAGFLGTVVMTLFQLADMFFAKRKSSNSPALAFSKIFRINFNKLSKKGKSILSYVVHFVYGTLWAFAVYWLYIIGVQNVFYLGFYYFVIVTVQAWVVIPLVGIGSPVWRWGLKSVIKGTFMHLVLAVATVWFFVLLM